MSALPDILNRLQGVRKSPNGHEARCPAHDDKRQSLSIASGADGRVLLKCHAGCGVAQITAALGLAVKDLFPVKVARVPLAPATAASGSGSTKAIAATYDYTDEAGNLLFQCVRFEPKDFRQRHKAPNGDWVWTLQGVRRVLYRLPEVLEAIGRDEPILIVEGEKDADNLRALGFTATCNPMGAGKWQDSYTATLRGAHAVIIPDKDAPGRDHAQAVAEALRGDCKSLKLLELPDKSGRGLPHSKTLPRDSQAQENGEAFGLRQSSAALASVKDASDWLASWSSSFSLSPGADLPDKLKLELQHDLRALIAKTPPYGSDPWLTLIEDAADIVQIPLPPIIEIVEGIVAERAKLVIGSGSKSFKTWLTMHLALAIAHGVPFLGRATARRRVLYCNLELKPQTFQRRIQAIAQALGIPVDRDWLHHAPLRGHVGGMLPFESISRIIKLAGHVQAEVVVLDPIYKLNTQGDENSSRDQTVFFNQLDRLTTEAGCTVILNDHFGKGNQSEKDPLDAIRGSSAKGGDVDAAMVLRKHQLDECFRVDMVHRELPPIEPFCIGWNYPLMQLRPDLDPDEMKRPAGGRTKAHEPKQLLAVIADTTRENPISISAWAKAAGLPRQTLIDYLPSLRMKGWLATIGEGSSARQYITESGRKALP